MCRHPLLLTSVLVNLALVWLAQHLVALGLEVERLGLGVGRGNGKGCGWHEARVDMLLENAVELCLGGGRHGGW